MGIYLVDRDLPGITREGLAAVQRAEIRASHQLTVAGQRVLYLRSMFIPGEARCMCLFEADDEAAVAAVNLAAQLPFSRIVEALDLTPWRPRPNVRAIGRTSHRRPRRKAVSHRVAKASYQPMMRTGERENAV